jgi:hypothetical protein
VRIKLTKVTEVRLLMAERDTVPAFTLAYRGSEWTPDRQVQYVSFEARSSAERFCGTTEFDASGEHLTGFEIALRAFYQTLDGKPELDCGWGEESRFRMAISRLDASGRVLLECRLRQPFLGGRHQSVQTHQIIELERVKDMADFLAAILAGLSREPLEIRSG